MPTRDRNRTEFGDFQTPDALAAQVVGILKKCGYKPATVVEPTCGLGAFIVASMHEFKSLRRIVGLEINHRYFAEAESRLARESQWPLVDLRREDFFSVDWRALLRTLPQPLLLIGNPPWVTSSGLGCIKSNNLPDKSNFKGHRGLDAITGKGNFDIAEWMLIKLIEASSGSNAILAMLIKTSVARRVLGYAWQANLPIKSARMYSIDTKEHFNVSAQGCLFVCELGLPQSSTECELLDLEHPTICKAKLGYRDGKLVANVEAYDRVRHLIRSKTDDGFRWRSGIKHDCSDVMELIQTAHNRFANATGDTFELESDFLFPMLKGSDVAAGRLIDGKKWMLVPQRSTNDDTTSIAERAPKTWDYLLRNGEQFDRRSSSIYQRRSRFAVFGVGPYTFAPWKIAICGLYKRLNFRLVGPFANKPVVFDDTVYQLPFDSEDVARQIVNLLKTEQACEFFNAMTFWDAKRPITAETLNRLNLRALAADCNMQLRVGRSFSNTSGGLQQSAIQSVLFDND